MSIQATKQNGIATVMLNRPDKLNALSAEMYQELADQFEALGKDDEVRAVVLTGAGRARSPAAPSLTPPAPTGA